MWRLNELQPYSLLLHLQQSTVLSSFRAALAISHEARISTRLSGRQREAVFTDLDRQTDRQTKRQTGGGTDGQSEYLSVTSCAHVWNRRRLPREVHFNAGCWMQRSLELSICEATTVGAIARLICGHICQQATTTATTTTTTRTTFLTNLTKKRQHFKQIVRLVPPRGEKTCAGCCRNLMQQFYHAPRRQLNEKNYTT